MLDQTTIKLFTPFPRDLGNPSRRVVHSLAEFTRFIDENNGVNDVLCSVYPRSGTVDKLWFDFDGKGAFEGAKKLYLWSTKKGFTTIPVASGLKGYHIYILLKPKQIEKNLLYEASQNVISMVYDGGGTSLDMHGIGDLRRMCRVPNTLRPPGNLNWCTYLPTNWVEMDEREIARHIKAPHTYQYDGGAPEISTFAKGTGRAAPQRSSFSLWKPNTSLLGFLGGVLRPCLYRRITASDPTHMVRVATTVDLLANFTTEEIFELFKALNWVDFNGEKTRYQIESCKHLVPYSCKKLRGSLRIKCVEECFDALHKG